MTWVDAIALEALPQDDVTGIEVAGRDLALYRVGDKVYASDNRCPHGAARLCDGFLEGHAIECPLHQGRFDVRDGEPLCEPADTPVRTYRARIKADRVEVQLD